MLTQKSSDKFAAYASHLISALRVKRVPYWTVDFLLALCLEVESTFGLPRSALPPGLVAEWQRGLQSGKLTAADLERTVSAALDAIGHALDQRSGPGGGVAPRLNGVAWRADWLAYCEANVGRDLKSFKAHGAACAMFERAAAIHEKLPLLRRLFHLSDADMAPSALLYRSDEVCGPPSLLGFQSWGRR